MEPLSQAYSKTISRRSYSFCEHSLHSCCCNSSIYGLSFVTAPVLMGMIWCGPHIFQVEWTPGSNVDRHTAIAQSLDSITNMLCCISVLECLVAIVLALHTSTLHMINAVSNISSRIISPYLRMCLKRFIQGKFIIIWPVRARCPKEVLLKLILVAIKMYLRVIASEMEGKVRSQTLKPHPKGKNKWRHVIGCSERTVLRME